MNTPSPKTNYYVICVDDDQEFLASLANPLEEALDRLAGTFDCQCEFVNSAARALELGQNIADHAHQCALIITDQRMPQTSGLELLEELRKIFPHAARVLLTGYAGLDTAKLAINKKLLDRYITKPICDIPEFSATIVGLVNEFHLQRLAQQQQQDLHHQLRLLEQANNRIARLKRAAEQVAYFTRDLGTLDLQEVLYITASRAPKVFGATHGLLVEFDPEGQLKLLRRFGYGCRKSLPCAQKLGKVLKDLNLSNEPCLIQELPRGRQGGQKRRSVLQIVIPVPVSDERHRTIRQTSSQEDSSKQSDPEQFLKKSCPTLLCLCCPQAEDFDQQGEEIRYKAALIRDIIGTNLAHATAYAESQRLSRYDSMTGLFARRVFEDRLSQACRESARYGRPLSLAIMDLDNFKHVNDTFGHLTGDLVLEEIGQLIRQNLRNCDVAARYGGDEFAVILPDTPPQGVQKLVERFRCKVAQHVFPFQHLKLTVSIGLATYDPISDRDAISLVHRADEAMYQAKGGGRNAVRCSSASSEQSENQTLVGV